MKVTNTGKRQVFTGSGAPLQPGETRNVKKELAEVLLKNKAVVETNEKSD